MYKKDWKETRICGQTRLCADERFSRKAMGGTRRKSFDIGRRGLESNVAKVWPWLSHCQNAVLRIQDLARLHGKTFDVLRITIAGFVIMVHAGGPFIWPVG